ncbi:hypothetical protein [Halarchaeum acidiphilum]
MSECPECGAELDLHESVEVGEIVDSRIRPGHADHARWSA